jgi:glutamine amidotransferase
MANTMKPNHTLPLIQFQSSGFPISESNCHPWSYGVLMFQHNGYISGFCKIKRRLQSKIPDHLFHHVQGNTDSEWAFALFLSLVRKKL